MMENQAPGGAEPYIPSLAFGQQVETLGIANPNQIDNAQNITPDVAELYWKLAGVAASSSAFRVLHEEADQRQACMSFTGERTLLPPYADAPAVQNIPLWPIVRNALRASSALGEHQPVSNVRYESMDDCCLIQHVRSEAAEYLACLQIHWASRRLYHLCSRS
jgi:hypothetical protein